MSAVGFSSPTLDLVSIKWRHIFLLGKPHTESRAACRKIVPAKDMNRSLPDESRAEMHFPSIDPQR